MRKLIFIVTMSFSLLACGGGGGSDQSKQLAESSLCQAGNLKVSNGRLCNSDTASPIVPLYLADSAGRIESLCSGTLLTSKTILTAAHCLDPQRGVDQVYVDIDGELTLYEVETTIMHPSSNGVAGNPHDIGIVKLKQGLENRQTAPLLLSASLESGELFKIYGYGNNGESGAGTLREGAMVLREAHDGVLEADYEDTENGICSGDSGGPAVSERDGLLGVVGVNIAASAFGCESGSVSVFADIQNPDNLDFILAADPGVRVL